MLIRRQCRLHKPKGWLEKWSDEKDGKLIVSTVFAVGMRHESSSKLAMQAFTIPLAAGRYAIVWKKSADSNWGPRPNLVGKSSNPVLQEGNDDILRAPVGQRDGLTPPSEAIHTQEMMPS